MRHRDLDSPRCNNKNIKNLSRTGSKMRKKILSTIV